MDLDLKRPSFAVQFFMFLRMVLSQTRLNQSEFEELSEEKLRAAQATYSGSWKSPPAADDDDLYDNSSDESSGGDSDDDDVQEEDEEIVGSSADSAMRGDGLESWAKTLVDNRGTDPEDRGADKR
ncbi:hypothetical protein BOTBODRAFT_432318 [Botryobasidium botryosum FD-172 SS1]|uniref:Uncharacterized protein n=1 Tax=Botryobasidium botryosum (strain FD-172 SS1) TaxID=930990 RepID=A0A067MB67_BOTB1|nr:hypothetical protein BOTBODRAFT_432318 [Botryobasidium botryosum FD-172 SS1]